MGRHRQSDSRGEVMSIRLATAGQSDLETIVHHRRSMFQDMGHADHEALDRMSARFLPWLRRMMEAGEYLAWFAIEDGAVVAGLGLWLMDWPPHMVASGDRRGNILNVYTEPAYRRRGLAKA